MNPTFLHARNEERARRLLNAAEVISGPDGALYLTLAQQTEIAREEWRQIASNRGVSQVTIAMVGEANSGKSYLASLLIRHPDAAARLRPGLGAGERSERLLWIGPQAPHDLATPWESHWRVGPEELEPLGCPYLLLDSPGTGDGSPELTRLARAALSSARLKVLVVTSERLGSEGYRDALARSDGSRILPAIHLSAKESQEPESVDPGRFTKWVEELRRRWPRAEILEPVLLPEIDALKDRAAAEAEVRQRLVDALRSALADFDPTRSSVQELEAAWERYRSALAAPLEDLLSPAVRRRHQQLVQALGALPEAVVAHLLRDGAEIRALLRHCLRQSLMEGLPAWSFPFRSFVGLFCLTTGAWDRLFFGLGGSLPSLVMSGMRAVRNEREERAARESVGPAMKARLETVVNATLLDPVRDLQTALERECGQEPTPVHEVGFDLHGGEQLLTRWEESLRETVEGHRLSHPFTGAIATFATLLFGFLIGAPLVHAYGQYTPAAFSSWSGHWGAFTIYPIMKFDFWAMALFLSFLPIAVLALLVVSLAVSRSRVKVCEAKWTQAWHERARDGGLGLEITLRDGRLEALRTLISEADQVPVLRGPLQKKTGQ